MRFEPSGPLGGVLQAPPDKSISHRAALLAAMSRRPVTIRRYLDSADTRRTLEAIARLGAEVGIEPEDRGLTVSVEGVGLRGPRQDLELDVGNAGTLIRLLSGWLAAQDGATYVLDGDESIRRRPMERVADPLRLMGAQIGTAEDGRPPLRISGSRLGGIDYEMPIASAQVKSALLLAGLVADGPTTIREPGPTRDHTEIMLRSAGVEVSSEARTALPTAPPPMRVKVEGNTRGHLELPDLSIAGDLSSAAFHLVAGLLVPGSLVRVEGVGLNPTRVGLLGILNRMGAAIEVEEKGHQAGELIGTITARHGELRGTRVSGAEVPLAIDELPLVALLGSFAEGDTVVSGAEELRHKESDRIASVVTGLSALGAEIEAAADGFIVTGAGGLPGGRIDAAGDHRIAMLGAIAGLASRGGVAVEGVEAAGVSYPGFESDLAMLVR